MLRKLFLSGCALAGVFCGTAQQATATLAFKNPPLIYRPGCYYYWISDNISKKGIEKDIRAMADAGIGRAFIGNVGFPESELSLKQGSAKLFSDNWWEATIAAVKAGAKNGVDIGFFNGPGWSQSGGPWISEQQSMRYLDAQEIIVDGPGVVTKEFPSIPFFQQVAVMAFPQPAYEGQELSKVLSEVSSNVDHIAIHHAFDGDTTTAVDFPAKIETPVYIDIKTNQPFTARSLTLYAPGRSFFADVLLQVKTTAGYETVKSFSYDRTNTALNVGFRPWAPVVVTFPEQRAMAYRLVLDHIRGTAGFSEIRLMGAAGMERIEEKQLAKMYQTPLPLWNEYQWEPQSPVTDKKAIVDPAGITDLTSMVSSSGKLSWKAPPGKWVILRFGMLPTGVTNAPATPEGRGYDVDKMNRAAVTAHFNAFIGKIRSRIPQEDQKAFKYVVADSYETGSQNWTDGFAASFKKKYGYDPLKWLPVLTGRVVGSREQSDRFLWDVRRLVADKVAYDYVGGLRDACHGLGLGLWLENYGHWGFPSEFLMYGGQSDEVGGEFWAEGDLGGIECRAASSAAHIYGKTSVSGESFTAGGQPFMRYPALLKQRGDWSFTEGINNTIFHVYIQQPDDRLPGINAWFGTEFNRHNTWFKQGKAFIQYIHRCNYMLQQGKPVNDIAYFIGEDAPKMTGVTDPALPKGFQFDYINAEVIEKRLSVKDGKLVLPDGMSYRMLVLPRLETMRPELLQKITDLVKAGAVVLGPAPLRSPSLQNFPAADRRVQALSGALWANADGVHKKIAAFGKGTVMNGLTVQEALKAIRVIPDFVSNTSHKIAYTHRSMTGKEIYFISNQADTLVDFTPLFREGRGQPYFYDAVTGEQQKLTDYTQLPQGMKIPLRLDVHQSGFVVFHKNETLPPATGKNFPLPYETLILKNPWTVTFDTSYRGPLQPVVFEQLQDWSMHPDERIRNYSGTAVYKTTFRVDPKPGEKVLLNLNKVVAMATVRLNGEDLGTVWTAPYKVDATAALVKGENKLEIEVVNTWVNRMIGDSKLPEQERRTWSNINPYKPESPYMSSGLLGPVQLEMVR
ncbi:glycoside hydrolase family 2 [Niabella ginsenosidivorans]|uniref:Glycoside hydrolase family 2 n=1 Tax=Niabella ginsenosidivorans TaxID=1176587 RepID=A0A1A9HZE5_9BACT|nr:glycosyl hydrolase [Niabella ginsenosidivorans]ANH80778.1 glycoside hydrolase family 2 [Niabella ginsenosidivorans]